MKDEKQGFSKCIFSASIVAFFSVMAGILFIYNSLIFIVLCLLLIVFLLAFSCIDHAKNSKEKKKAKELSENDNAEKTQAQKKKKSWLEIVGRVILVALLTLSSGVLIICTVIPGVFFSLYSINILIVSIAFVTIFIVYGCYNVVRSTTKKQNDNSTIQTIQKRKRGIARPSVIIILLVILVSWLVVPFYNDVAGYNEVWEAPGYIIVKWQFVGEGSKIYPLPYDILFSSEPAGNLDGFWGKYRYIRNLETIWNRYEAPKHGWDFHRHPLEDKS